ncbi:MAG: hypothetical protein HY791_21010 [Deltaproteobacteria bacterium]|nr:hypothetical protein [Deltaproteobacteria bacterium]
MSERVPAVVSISTTVDLDPLVVSMARQSHAESGVPLDEAELQAVRDRAGRDLDVVHKAQADELSETISKVLPAGARLVAVEAKRKGLVVTSRTSFSVDDLSVVPNLVLSPSAPGGDPIRPFASFTVTRAGRSISILGAAPDLPGAAVRGSVRFELEVSAKVASHNATTVDGKRLSWESPFGGQGLVIRAEVEG